LAAAFQVIAEDFAAAWPFVDLFAECCTLDSKLLHLTVQVRLPVRRERLMATRFGPSVVILVSFLSLVGFAAPGTACGQNQSAPDQGNAQKTGQEAYRSDVDLVSVYFTVRDDKKRLVSDLPQERFSVTEEGQPETIKFFAHHSDVVLNVGILLDTGTNMSWLLEEEAQASGSFLRHVVRHNDLGFVLSYASRVDTLQLPTSDVVLLHQATESIAKGAAVGLQDRDAMPDGISIPGGGTVGIDGRRVNTHRAAHLYDAVRVGTHRYLEGEVGRKAIVIVALSGDSGSESTLADDMDALLADDVIAYVLQIYDGPKFKNCDVVHAYDKDASGEQVLKKLAEATGGRMLEVHGIDKLDAALDEIADELHHQYSLGYYPQNKNWDGKFRKIQISAGETYQVHARKGYYAKSPAAKVAQRQSQ
jgi:VWFA-related protein